MALTEWGCLFFVIGLCIGLGQSLVNGGDSHAIPVAIACGCIVFGLAIAVLDAILPKSRGEA